jgi:hypothetical protein
MLLRISLTVLLVIPAASYGKTGCYDRQVTEINAADPDTSEIAAYVSCGRFSDLCNLYVRIPNDYDSALLIYDNRREKDYDLTVSIPVYDWDTKEIESRFNNQSELSKFLSPSFHGTEFQISRDFAKHATLSFEHKFGCFDIQINDLSPWFKENE